jgi:hypothetical protein
VSNITNGLDSLCRLGRESIDVGTGDRSELSVEHSLKGDVCAIAKVGATGVTGSEVTSWLTLALC